jgi:hypothetical protein
MAARDPRLSEPGGRLRPRAELANEVALRFAVEPRSEVNGAGQRLAAVSRANRRIDR